MQVYTVQLAQWRQVPEDVKLLDTTARTGTSPFAPDWSIVKGIKNGSLTEGQYTNKYYGMLSLLLIKQPEVYEEVFQHDKVAIACMCPEGKFCHRLLLKNFLLSLGKATGKEIKFAGEIRK
jgi:hypothetical protein